MDADDFITGLKADGYDEIVHKDVAAGTWLGEHDHPWDTRLLVLDGALTLGVAGEARTYRSGERFDLARGVRHSERYDPDRETRLVIGRRR
jgi:quercetin dioxygenase-like cupin family protein